MRITNPVPILTREKVSLMVPVMKEKLKDILKAARAFDKELEDKLGDETHPGVLQAIWEKGTTPLDTEAGRLAYFKAIRCVGSALKQHCGFEKIIEDMIETLEHVKIVPETPE